MKWTLRFASLGTYCFKQEPADSGAGDGGSDAGHPHQPHVEDQGQELRHAVRRPRPGTDPIFTCGEASRSMDDNRSPPPPVIQAVEAFMGQRTTVAYVIEVTEFNSEVVHDL